MKPKLYTVEMMLEPEGSCTHFITMDPDAAIRKAEALEADLDREMFVNEWHFQEHEGAYEEHAQIWPDDLRDPSIHPAVTLTLVTDEPEKEEASCP